MGKLHSLRMGGSMRWGAGLSVALPSFDLYILGTKEVGLFAITQDSLEDVGIDDLGQSPLVEMVGPGLSDQRL